MFDVAILIDNFVCFNHQKNGTSVSCKTQIYCNNSKHFDEISKTDTNDTTIITKIVIEL